MTPFELLDSTSTKRMNMTKANSFRLNLCRHSFSVLFIFFLFGLVVMNLISTHQSYQMLLNSVMRAPASLTILDHSKNAQLTQSSICQYSQSMKLDPTAQGKFMTVDITKFPRSACMPSERQILPVGMTVYANNDIVSQYIRVNGAWDQEKLQMVISALDRVQMRQRLVNPPATFLDIGGNIGWFTLGVASAGFRAVAFEPMPQNIAAIRQSICANPAFMERVVLHGVGLGSETMLCSIVSDNENEGDGHMKCSIETSFGEDYSVRDGAIRVVRLDDFMNNEKVAVVKIDIEGFEAHALAGGEKTLLKSKIPYIVTEVSLQMMLNKGSDALLYVAKFVDAGYAVSKRMFDDPNPLTRSQWIDAVSNSGIVDLFLTLVEGPNPSAK